MTASAMTIGVKDFYGPQTTHTSRHKSGRHCKTNIDENIDPRESQPITAFPRHSLLEPQELKCLTNGFQKQLPIGTCSGGLNGLNTCLATHKRRKSKTPEKITKYLKPITNDNDININDSTIDNNAVTTTTTTTISDQKSSDDWETDWWVHCNDDEVDVIGPNVPIGLKNLGNSCYMSSVVQCLFALKLFIDDLDTSLAKMADKSMFVMTGQLLHLFGQYDGLRTQDQNSSFEELNKCLSELKACIGQKWTPFVSCSQQDAAEFFAHVIDTIAEEFEDSGHRNLIWDQFGYEMKRSLECKACGHHKTIESEKFHALGLTLTEDRSLATALQRFLDNETTGHKCDAENCLANENILRKCISKHPTTLFLQLGRYTEDLCKHTEQVIVPQVIQLSAQRVKTPSADDWSVGSTLQEVSKVVPNISLDAISSDDQSDEVEYRLVAVICHLGTSLHAGHYTALVLNDDTQQWYECDDSRVIAIDSESVRQKSQKCGYCYIYVNNVCI